MPKPIDKVSLGLVSELPGCKREWGEKWGQAGFSRPDEGQIDIFWLRHESLEEFDNLPDPKKGGGQACIGEWSCARDLMSDFYVSTILVSPILLKQSRFGDSVE